MSVEPIVPVVTPDFEPFFEAAAREQLVVQKCSSCSRLRFPPRGVCPDCLGVGSDWTEVSGRGEVYSFIWMHQVYHPAFAEQAPYPVAVVQLEEGPMMTTNILDCTRESLVVGMPVEVVFEPRGEVRLPQFRPRNP